MTDALVAEILELRRTQRLVPLAIADVLNLSDIRVLTVLRAEHARKNVAKGRPPTAPSFSDS